MATQLCVCKHFVGFRIAEVVVCDHWNFLADSFTANFFGVVWIGILVLKAIYYIFIQV